MKRGIAGAILTTMFAGLLALAAWAGSAIVENKVNIKELKTEKVNMHEDIIEIKKDVKALLRRR